MLRAVVVAVAGLGFVVLLVRALNGHGHAWPAIAWLALVLAALIFERRRYRPAIRPTSAAWEATGERFADPTTGEKLEVFYNAQTGERDYRAS